MKKVLFFEGKEKNEFISSLKNQLKIKNRLLGLIISNSDRKTSQYVSSLKSLKYEQQIIMLENILSYSMRVKTREDIRKLNAMIDQYNSLDEL